MSRVGKLPVELPKGVKAAISSGSIQVEGPKGKLSFRPGVGIDLVLEGSKVIVSRRNDSPQVKANHGTARAIINNMAVGVDKGWNRTLELSGVGYTAKLQGAKLTLAVGFSHDVTFDIPKEIKCLVDKNTVIKLEGPDRHAIGALASAIRKVQPPEPYLGKGIKYSDEVVRRKAGKTGKK